MDFGKFSGCQLWQVDRSYVNWMSQTRGFFEDKMDLARSLARLGLLRRMTDAEGNRVLVPS